MNREIRLFGHTLIFLCLLFKFVSCSIFMNMDKPRVREIFPRDNAQVAEGVVPHVSFDQRMNHNATERAVAIYRIETGGKKQSIGFSPTWQSDGQGETLILRTLQRLQNGVYAIEVAKTAENQHGQDLFEGTNVVFRIGSDFSPPVLQQVLPTNGSVLLDRRTSFDVVFQEPLDIPSPLEAVAFSPSIDYTVDVYPGTNGFRVIPRQDLPAGRLLLIIKQVKDMAGNRSTTVHTNVYQVGTNSRPFQLNGVRTNDFGWFLAENVTHGIDKTNALVFSFSHPVDFSSEAIRVSPPVEGIWTAHANTVVFRPRDFWDIGQTYSIVVGEVRDNEGRQLSRSHRYFFSITNPFLSVVSSSAHGLTLSLTFNQRPKLPTLVDNMSVQILGTVESFPYYTISLTGSQFSLSMVSNPPSSLKVTILGGKGGVRDVHNNWMNTTNHYFLLR